MDSDVHSTFAQLGIEVAGLLLWNPGVTQRFLQVARVLCVLVLPKPTGQLVPKFAYFALLVRRRNPNFPVREPCCPEFLYRVLGITIVSEKACYGCASSSWNSGCCIAMINAPFFIFYFFGVEKLREVGLPYFQHPIFLLAN